MINLAIVIPYYKKAHFRETLNSLKAQKNQNFNVYIGDDASPESPESLIIQLGLHCKVNYHRFHSNLGQKSLTKQWERCVNLIKGNESWVMILCDDDILSENCIQEFYDHYENIIMASSNVIRFATIVVDEKGKTISKIYKHPRFEFASDFLVRKESGGTRSSLSEYIFKSELIKSKGFMDLELGWYSDVLAILEISGRQKIYTINEAIVLFRITPNSISGNVNEEPRKTISLLRYYSVLLLNFSNSFEQVDLLFFKNRFKKIMFENKRNFVLWFLYFQVTAKIKLRRISNFITLP